MGAEERRISTKKRQWKAKSHEEQARVLEMALEPLGRARTRAEDKGERGVAKDIRKGEVLQDRLKLLLFANAEGSGAANIYAGAVEVASDSEDERRMRKATKEAKVSVKRGSEGGRKPFRQGRAATAGVAAAISSAGAGQQAPTGQPAMPRELVCWSCGGKKATSKGIAPPNSSSRSNSRLGPEQAVCDQVRPEAMPLLSDKFCLLSDYDEEIYSASVCSDGEWVMEGEEGCTGEVWREGERELVMHGRLAKCIPFRKEMGASKWVVSILKGGYRLPFVSDHRGGLRKTKVAVIPMAASWTRQSNP